MNIRYLALAFSLLLSSVMCSSAMAEDVAVESTIREAIVYNDRATLTRQAKVQIPAGAHKLVFTGLPVQLFPDSLRVEGKAVAKVTFGALSYKIESHEDYVVPKEKALRDLLQKLQDQIALYQVEKNSISAGQKFLDRLGEQAALRENEDIAKIDLNPQEWRDAADGLQSKSFENYKALQALDISIRDVNEQMRKANEELAQLRTGQKQTYSVEIPFESAAATVLTVDLSYQISNVGWFPVYDARLDVEKGKLDLVQYGSVWQRTGEDWSDIDLTLSTAQPSRGTGLPELETQWISLMNYQVQAQKTRMYEESARSVNITGMAMDSLQVANAPAALAKEEVDAGFVAAQINTEGFVGEYDITGLSTVKADGTQSKLLIGAFDTDNVLQVQVKPQMSAEAYLVAKSTLKGDAPILPGTVNLFRNGAYIGQTQLPMLHPGDIQEIAFGIDDHVTVKRNILKDERSESGLINKENILERHYVTEIQNLHKDNMAVAVLETVPVSTDEQIRVEILKEATTQGYEQDLYDVKGLTRWLVTLSPQEKTKINLGWKVYWPKDQNVSGL